MQIADNLSRGFTPLFIRIYFKFTSAILIINYYGKNVAMTLSILSKRGNTLSISPQKKLSPLFGVYLIHLDTMCRI